MIIIKFKRDESPIDNAGKTDDVKTNNSSSFKYKSSILGKPAVDDNNNGVLKKCKNSCSNKTSNQCLAIIRNAFDQL